MRLRPLAVAVLALAATLGTAQAQSAPGPQSVPGPLSAIDWLRRAETPSVPPAVGAYAVTPPANVADGGISVRRLDAMRPEAVGLYPASRVGLPATLWKDTGADTLVPLIRALPDDTLPALRDLALRLLLAEFEAPLPSVTLGAEAARPDFLLARLEVLERIGAVDQAVALLEALGSSEPALRRHRFALSLLIGDEDRVCDTVVRPDPPIGDDAALIYCLARQGAWEQADAVLVDGIAQGRIDAATGDLLTHFLHAEEAEGAMPLPPPQAITPLQWRVIETLGEPIGTQSLPVAFAHADLRGTSGWRAQIEAAERLVRSRALPPNRLLGLYTERRAAASGGIWERVRSIAALDAALVSGDAERVGRALVDAWPQVQAGELEVAIADLFAQSLAGLDLAGEARALAFDMGLLSRDYETVALGLDLATASPRDKFLAAVARGLDPVAGGGEIPGELALAVAEAFGPNPPLPPGTAEALVQGRLGAAMLRVLDRMDAASDPRLLAEGLAELRLMGLEDSARRAALEVLLIERRG